jgi:hypothetical protein
LDFAKNVLPPLGSKLLVMCERAALKIMYDVQYTLAPTGVALKSVQNMKV